jgi:lipid II:glycine glycyltransferase (peptidoglycan interpeptide bridge formation enzyme)
MAMRLATAEEIDRWDELIAQNPDGGMSLQSKTWGDFKSRWGWEPHRFIYEMPDGRVVSAQWLRRDLGLSQVIWYCPKGPGVVTATDYREVVLQSRGVLKGILARFESEVLDDDMAGSELEKLGLRRSNRDPGSKATIFIDLARSDEELLSSFNQSARRNMRKAEAGGVVVKAVESDESNVATMFELMRATEARAHYGLRPKAYFIDYWRSLSAANQGQLLFASVEDEVLAGIFVTRLGTRSWYKDGGSFDKRRELNATYIMQLEAMRWLTKQGVKHYDMVGVPNRSQVGTGDSRDGLYEFKSKFNPDITEFIGAYDLVHQDFSYRAWLSVGERVAARLASRRPEKFLY